MAVSIVDVDGDAIELRLWLSTTLEPEIALVNEGAGRLLVSLPTAVRLYGSLPLPQPGGLAIEAFTRMSMHERDNQTELEIVLAQPMDAVLLRRDGNAWIVRMSPRTGGLPQPRQVTAPVPAPTTAVRLPPTIGPVPPAPVIGPAAVPLPASPAPAAAARQQPAPPATAVQPNHAPAPAPVPSTASGAEVLLLDLTVNDQPAAELAQVELLPGGGVLVAAPAWEEARLAVPGPSISMSDGTPGYRLDQVPGATLSIDRLALRMRATVPAGALVGSRLQFGADSFAPPPRPALGALLNYSVAATGGKRTEAGANGLLEGIVFGPAGSLVNSVLIQNSGQHHNVERLDSYWRYDMPDRLETLILGDTIGTASGWSRPVHYAGVRWGRDFTMRPGYITFPQAGISSDAALPSTVDVLVNNAQRMHVPVAPGPFQLPDVPLVTGAGEINVIVRDMLGNERVITQNYYAAPRMLAPGLTDFSLEAGRMRFGYGEASHYAQQFAAGTFRAGLATDLTTEVRAEWQGARQAAGVEVTSLVGHWAVAHVALAHARGSVSSPSERGNMLSAGIERTTAHGGAAISYEQADRHFAPFGEALNPDVALGRPRQRLLATVGGALVGSLNGGLSYVRQTRWDGDRAALAGLSLGAPLPFGASMSLSLNRELLPPYDWQAGMLVSIPLGLRDHSFVQMQKGSMGKSVATVNVSRSVPAGTGLGWDLQASNEDSQRARAALRYNSDWSELYGETALASDGSPAGRVVARGSVGTLAGKPFLSRPIGQGSFAVVDVGGVPAVPVLRSHQVVATTDAHGLALVPGLLPWQDNQIEIDPLALPLDAQAASLSQQVRPFAASGMAVHFDVTRTRQALLVVHLPDGQPVPKAARARLLPNGPEFIGGLRGEFWLDNLPTGPSRLALTWPGGNCTVQLPPGQPNEQPEHLGPLTCTKTSP